MPASRAIPPVGTIRRMEMAPVQADCSVQLLQDSLTCQPRLVSKYITWGWRAGQLAGRGADFLRGESGIALG